MRYAIDGDAHILHRGRKAGAGIAGEVEDDLVRLSGNRVERLLDAALAAVADQVQAPRAVGRRPAARTRSPRSCLVGGDVFGQ